MNAGSVARIVLVFVLGCGPPEETSESATTDGANAGTTESGSLPSEAPVLAPLGEVETIEDHWDDGAVRVRRQVRRDGEGFLNHGLYQRFFKTGVVQEEGRVVVEGGGLLRVVADADDRGPGVLAVADVLELVLGPLARVVARGAITLEALVVEAGLGGRAAGHDEGQTDHSSGSQSTHRGLLLG